MEVTLDDLQQALSLASNAVVAFLQDETVDPHALTAGGEWTVGDTAAHLIGITRLYTRMLDGQPSPIHNWDDVELMNAEIFRELVEDHPPQLAGLVEEAVDGLLQASRRVRPDDQRPFHFGGTATVARHVAALSYEYLLHGADMESAVGQQWSCPERAAETTFAYIFLAPTITARFDPRQAKDVDATFSVGLDAETRLLVQVRAGRMERLPTGGNADCLVTGTAPNLLLWLSGRSKWESAGLSATGQLADLAPLFATFFING